jgi:serine protease
MPRVRLLWAVAALSLSIFGVAGHGQTVATAVEILENVGLPAVEEGAIGIRGSIHHSDLSRVGVAGRRYVPGRVLVKFRNGTTTAARLSALSAMPRTNRSAAIQTRPDYADFDVVAIDPSADAEAMADALRQQSDVEYAQPAYRVHAEFVPNDPLYSQLQWNLPLIDMERAWDIQPQAGSTITVAVLDTGAAYMNATITATAGSFVDDRGVRYPALGRLTLPYSAAPQLGGASRFVAPRDFIANMTPLDFDGHGTHVSGTIGQLTNDGVGVAGVAFNVKLMPVKVLASQWDVIFGFAPDVGGSDDDVARGLRSAADNGAKIINMSLGSAGPANCGTNPRQEGCSPVIEDAMRYAVGRGAFVVVAGGNDFTDGNPPQVIADIASRIEGAVSVAAVDKDKNRTFYSSTGDYIELAAPGGGAVGSSRDGYVWQQTFDFTLTDTFTKPPSTYGPPRFDVLATIGYAGTSQATPHVSGVAAMLAQQGITDPAAIEAALEKFATDLGTTGRDPSFGFGLVEARNTLRGLGLAK